MRKLALIVAALALSPAVTGCAFADQLTANSPSARAHEAEVDRAYTDFGVLIARVTRARTSGAIVVGSPVALRLAGNIRSTRSALQRGDVVAARASMALIEGDLP